MFLTPEELMVGGSTTYDLEIPPEILHPDGKGEGSEAVKKKIKLRPLTIKDIQLIAKAAKEDEVLTSILMIQKAVIEPELQQQEVARMHSGLVQFLVERINAFSGLSTSADDLEEMVQSPIVRAFFVLAKEFNWTPEQVKEMTLGQIMGYLEMLNQTQRNPAHVL